MSKRIIATAVAGIVCGMAMGTAQAGGITVLENGDSKLAFESKVFTKLVSEKITDSTAATDTKTTSASVDRAYFTVKYNFDKEWLMRVTTDVRQASSTELTEKNDYVFLKYAYLEGKLAGKAAVLRLGQSHTPWIDYEQGLWKHRYFQKVLSDQNGYDASSDLGVGLKGDVADGKAHYWATLTNGAGYSHTDRKGKSMDFDGRIGYDLIPGMTLDLQYRNGYKATKTQTIAGGAVDGTKSTLYQVMATYSQNDSYRVGVNYASNKTAPAASASVRQTAYSVWGWTKLPNNFGAFARYEHTKDNDATTTDKLKKTHYGAGVEYFPVKHVTLALGYDQVKSNNNGSKDTKDSQVGVWSEFAF